MLPKASRTPAQDPLLLPNDRFSSQDRAQCWTVFLFGMVVAGLLVIAFALVLLFVKGKMDQKVTNTPPLDIEISKRNPWKGFKFEHAEPIKVFSIVLTDESLIPRTMESEESSGTSPESTRDATLTSSITSDTLTIDREPTTERTTTIASTTTTKTPPTTVTTSETTTPTVITTTTSGTTSNNEPPLPPNTTCSKRIIGYYTDTSSTAITKAQVARLTHAVFTHDFLTASGTIVFQNEDAETRFLTLRAEANSTKVMISIGGENHFWLILQNEKKRSDLVASIASFLDKHNIDGVDLFWKWPTVSDKVNYSSFVKTLREKLPTDKILSVTSAPAGILGYWPDGFDLEEMIKHVDFMNIFSMDFYGPWGQETGPAAPLYSGVIPRQDFNVNYTMQYYVCKLREPKKLNIVVPFDVRIWEDVGEALTKWSEIFRRAEMKSGGLKATVFKSRKLAEETGIKFSEASWDDWTKSSYVLNKNSSWISTFEDYRSVGEKLKYVNRMDLGGVWLRAVDMDDGSSSLLESISFDGFCAAGSNNNVKYQC